MTRTPMANSKSMDHERTYGKEFIQALWRAQGDKRLGGITLTNDDPEADYKAIRAKNDVILAEWSLALDRSLEFEKDGSVVITMNLLHKPSGQFVRSQSGLKRERHENAYEEESPEVFRKSRFMYEMLIGIVSHNNEIEAEIYGPTKTIGGKVKKTFIKQEDILVEKARRESLLSMLGVTLPSYKDISLEERVFSWATIKLFQRCKRCFYNQEKLSVRFDGLENRLYGLEKAAETLLKREFDQCRNLQKPHPIMEDSHAIKPLRHKKIDVWRCAYDTTADRYGKRGGIRFYNPWENWTVYGGVDDVWLSQSNELIVVDYKSSSNGKIYPEYEQQIAFYAWIFRKMNYSVSSIGYILMYQPNMNRDALEWQLNFQPTLHPIDIDDSWVEPTIREALACLASDDIPDPGSSAINKNKTCELCHYFDSLTRKMSAHKE